MYIDVVLPLALETYTYKVDTVLMTYKVEPGMRVAVPLRRKIYTGIVVKIDVEPKSTYEIKSILAVLDKSPMLTLLQLRFWEWIANYYQCTLGEVYKAAVPSAFKIESETEVRRSDVEITQALTEKEQQLLLYFDTEKSVLVKDLEQALQLKNILTQLKSLIEMNLIVVGERLQESYKPKREEYVRFSPAIQKEEDAEKALIQLKNAKNQVRLFTIYLRYANGFGSAAKPYKKKDLLVAANVSLPILIALVQKGYLEIFSQEKSRIESYEEEIVAKYPLNAYQQEAYIEVAKQFQDKNVVLLHGVTSSGKTEIYIHLIEQVVAQGKQVLFLLPEIALTTQLTARLRRVFGDTLCVYHSKFTEAERVEIWNKLLKDETIKIVVGVRSAVFLPFRNLGFVVVDEEHETTYKQFDPAPRYHARNAAIVLAQMYGGKVLLGTATPSIETYNNALTGKYGLVELTHRHKDVQMPKIRVVNMREERRKKLSKGIFSSELLREMEETIARGEQVILFQNRRGFASFIECEKCGYVPRCKNCAVSLTVHKKTHLLTCHYCGYSEPIPTVCPTCKSEFENRGFGTERIEDELENYLPEIRIGRMDLDTTRSRTAYEKIIHQFEDGELDVLIGTQMLTKGLDFGNVGLVGILNADNLMNMPDFRATERAYQLMAQVSGRAGRGGKEGLVLLQTSDVDNPVITQVIQNDYKAMYKTQMEEREMFKYPPYYRLIYIELKHKNEFVAKRAAQEMARQMREVFDKRVLGPDEPLIARIQTYYIQRIVLKLEVSASADKTKKILSEISHRIRQKDDFKSLFISLDVDPM